MNDPPRFAVVGRVNKGKSSIVATLAEDDTVRIDPRPLAKHPGQVWADAVDVLQRDDHGLVVRDVDTENTRHPS